VQSIGRQAVGRDKGSHGVVRKKESPLRKPRRSLFDPKNFLTNAGEGRTIFYCHHDQIVFSQGEAADAVFYIQQGKVKFTVLSQQGKDAVIAILGPGQFFGEGCLHGQTWRLATARALTECVITRLEKATMLATIQRERKFSELFMNYLLTRKSRIEEDLIDQLFNSSEKRLARLLLLLANSGKDGKLQPIIANGSQETLAEMIGSTRSRVCFFMNRFREAGLIDYDDDRIEVRASLLTVVLNDQSHVGS
jgi:CRP/FNR family transcriptional regulator, cyclic AMP receptor protein